MKIPVCALEIGEREVEYVAKCIRSGWNDLVKEEIVFRAYQKSPYRGQCGLKAKDVYLEICEHS